MEEILFICAMPQGHCGVADYTLRLARTLDESGSRAAVLSSPCAMQEKPSFLLETAPGWGLFSAFSAKRAALARKPSVVHFQYPAQGFGHKLGPQLLSVLLKFSGTRTVLTLHEFKHAHPLRKLSALPLLAAAGFVFFTSDEERDAVSSFYPFLKGKLKRNSAIVAVGCPLDVKSGTPKPEGKPVVTYFGLFYPGKLAEFALDTFCEMEKKRPGLCRYVFAGDKHPRHTAYYETVRGRADALLDDSATWHVGLSSAAVAEKLEQASVFVLPYAGGASFRRTTLNCALLCGAPVVTMAGPSTPPQMKDGENIVFAQTPAQAADAVLRLLEDKELYGKVSAGGLALGESISWQNIAAEHLSVYGKLK